MTLPATSAAVIQVLFMYSLSLLVYTFSSRKLLICLEPKSFRFLCNPAKHIPDRLQITITIEIVRLQIAGFGPFVPAVDGHEGRLGTVGIDIVPCRLKCFLYRRRGIVLDDARTKGLESGIVVPSNGNMGEIGYSVVSVHESHSFRTSTMISP
jgi:hypothetical protein